MRHGIRSLVLAALTAAALGGCGDDAPTNPPPGNGITPIDFVEPDFSLADANPNSTTHLQSISPRSCLGKISAWYFGHSI
jgi:predicted small lipoprotein YifL